MPFHYLVILRRPLLLVILDVSEVRLAVDAFEVAVSAREHGRRPVGRRRHHRFHGGLGRVAACHVVLERRCLQVDRTDVEQTF